MLAAHFNVMGVGFLIVTVYFICVIYVLYQMALSVEAKLEDQVKIVLDGEALQAAIANQLLQQDLYQAQAEVQADDQNALLKITFFDQEEEAIGVVAFDVRPVGKRPLEPAIHNLNVTVVNTLPDQQVFVNWDYSAISVHGGTAQRVIRQAPGSPIDLHAPQVVTVVNPGLQTNVSVTSEGLLNRAENQMSLSATSSLVDLSQIPDMKEPLRQYALQMVIWVRSARNPNAPALQLLVPYMFRIEVLPDHVALPVLSWLLNFNPFTLIPSQKSR